jgi:hypothetical protein
MSTIDKKVVKAAGRYVTTEHVDALIRNYKKDRWLQNSERIGKEDTLSLWLTTDELEEFIQTSKMYGADGIRVCFGVYGENARAPRPHMVGMQTVAFVATTSEIDSTGNPVQKDIYVEKDGDTSVLAYNQVIFPFPATSPGTVPPPSYITMGSMMVVTDKEKGLQVI